MKRTVRLLVLAVLVALGGLTSSWSQTASAQDPPPLEFFPDDLVDPRAPVNGCGSQGEDGVDVPDSWFGVSFTDGCNWHDRCYGTKGLSQRLCDDGMYYHIAEACGPGLSALPCRNMGKVYLVTVSLLGGEPYRQGQMDACERTPHLNGRFFGDPHLDTFDGVRYDVMNAGEFTMVRGADGRDIVQSRFLPVNDAFTSTSGVAVRLGDDVVAVQHDPATRGLDIYVNGQLITGHLIALEEGTVELGERLEGINQIATIRRNDYLRVEAVAFDSRLDVSINVFEEHFGTISGLLGDADGNPDNDLMDATTGQTIDLADIGTSQWINDFYDSGFSESWRVEPADSMFVVDGGFDYHSDEARSWPREIRTPESLYGAGFDAAQRACIDAGLSDEDMLNCIYDVIVSGDESYAETSALSLSRATAVASPELATTPLGVVAEGHAGHTSEEAETVESSPLIQLIIQRDADGLRAALAAGEPVNVVSEREQITPLIAAMSFGDASMVQILLDGGADPNLTAGALDALTQATNMGNLELTVMLLEAGADPDGHPTEMLPLSPLGSAIRSPEIVKVLLDAGADPDGGAALVAAAASGVVETAELLLDYGADVDIDSDPGPGVTTALFNAVVADDVDMVRLLLSNGANPHAIGVDLTTLAVSDEVRKLLERL